jgi:transposase InsO family protein
VWTWPTCWRAIGGSRGGRPGHRSCLVWHRPGTVWGADFKEPREPIAARYGAVLSVRDLASRCQLLWEPVEEATAETVVEHYRRLFAQDGPPLVLKTDNGGPFKADRTKALLAEQGVAPLFNPKRRPAYNGGTERANATLTGYHATRLPELAGPLTIHAQFTRDEILVGIGHWSLGRRPDLREGVLHLAQSKVDAFFVTLQKTEEDYSPTTMYEDYLISHELFHWQSQSNTSAESPTGRRYIRHRELGYVPLLFVRDSKTSLTGLAAPYVFLGPCDYVSHEGSRPMSIVWRLKYPVPVRLFRMMARQSVG